MVTDKFINTRNALHHGVNYLQTYFTSWYPGGRDKHAKLGEIVENFLGAAWTF
jgi:hypothetical protein